MRRVLRSTKGKKPPRYRHTIKENKRLWHIWNGMKRRCLSTIDLRYHEYGGRGIKICDAWVESFDNFADWALSNGYEDDLTREWRSEVLQCCMQRSSKEGTEKAWM